MKKSLLDQMLVVVVLFISCTNLHCKKEAAYKFCDVQRSSYMSVDNREGTIVYFSKYNRYAVSFAVTTPNNIDSQTIGFPCELDRDFQKIGLQVVVSGTLERFNANENVKPEIGGQELYFLKASQIIRK